MIRVESVFRRLAAVVVSGGGAVLGWMFIVGTPELGAQNVCYRCEEYLTGPVCLERENCVNLWGIYTRCETEYFRWPREAGEG